MNAIEIVVRKDKKVLTAPVYLFDEHPQAIEDFKKFVAMANPRISTKAMAKALEQLGYHYGDIDIAVAGVVVSEQCIVDLRKNKKD